MQQEGPCLFQTRCPNDTLLVKAPKGSTIFLPEQRISHVFHIHKGVVALFLPTEDGHEILIGLFVPPNFIGLLAFTGMYSDKQLFTHAEARAMTPVVYCKVKREAVWNLLDDHQARAQVFEMIYSVMFLTSRLSAIPLKSDIEMRIVTVLYALAEGVGTIQPDESILIPNVSHESIAAMGNTTRSTVSRVLQRFEQEGLVLTNRREIVIVSMSALLAHCPLLAAPLL